MQTWNSFPHWRTLNLYLNSCLCPVCWLSEHLLDNKLIYIMTWYHFVKIFTVTTSNSFCFYVFGNPFWHQWKLLLLLSALCHALVSPWRGQWHWWWVLVGVEGSGSLHSAVHTVTCPSSDRPLHRAQGSITLTKVTKNQINGPRNSPLTIWELFDMQSSSWLMCDYNRYSPACAKYPKRTDLNIW